MENPLSAEEVLVVSSWDRKFHSAAERLDNPTVRIPGVDGELRLREVTVPTTVEFMRS